MPLVLDNTSSIYYLFPRVIVRARAQDNALRMRVLLVLLVRLVISTADRPTMNAA